jgi:hypothetical protein
MLLAGRWQCIRGQGQRLWSLGEFPNRQAAAHMGVVEKVSCGSWVFFIDPLL